jgi:uncharacterized protein with PIN domain
MRDAIDPSLMRWLKALDRPLLYKGEDFSQTDIRSAL